MTEKNFKSVCNHIGMFLILFALGFYGNIPLKKRLTSLKLLNSCNCFIWLY